MLSAIQIVIFQPPDPLLLTLPPSTHLRITGPSLLGVRLGSPFLYRIPASTVRPMEFAVDGLPAGLGVDRGTEQISGSLNEACEYALTLRANNTAG